MEAIERQTASASLGSSLEVAAKKGLIPLCQVQKEPFKKLR